MDEKDKKKKDENEVNDPMTSYGEGKNRIVFFNSFEEENEYTAKQAASINPVTMVKNTVKVILVAYGLTRESLAKRKSSDMIYIDKE